MNIAAIGTEHGRIRQPMFNQDQTEQSIVYMVKIGSGKANHVDIDPSTKAIHQGFQHGFRSIVVAVTGVDKIDAQNADSLLL